jgi:predicted O-methyltransferase YrrM
MGGSSLLSTTLEFITSDAVITPQLSANAIIRQEAGFETDFLVLHCLIKKYQPKNLFEVGTCQGYGTLIMANACPSCSIISLDLPPQTAPFFLKPADIGRKCNRPFRQVFGDSISYNYSQHFPIDAWFIDGAHDYEHVKHETQVAIKSNAQLIVYHDTDISEVLQAIVDALEGSEYTIYRITDTRVSYAIK